VEEREVMRDGLAAGLEAMIVEGRDGWTTVIIPDGTDTAQFVEQLWEIGYDAPKGTQIYLGEDGRDVFRSPEEFLDAIKGGRHRGRLNAPGW
jgi:hypothetical protein